MIRRRTVCPVLFVAIVAACGSAPPPPPSPSLPPASPPPASAPAGPMMPLPPDAAIAGDDGVIVGQLGTFTWGDDGSSSPWLPGAPVTVTNSAALRVGLSDGAPVRRWVARYAAAGDPSPMGTVPLRSGVAVIEFPPPPPGEWTVELFVVYGPGVAGQDLGEASYFWRMSVR